MLKTELLDRVTFITLDSTHNLNALNNQLCFAIKEAIELAYKNNSACIVLQAECRNGVWSAGHDIKELPLDGADPLNYNVPLEQLLRTVQNIPIPVIASLGGSVWGGACDLALSCDMIVASECATFAITPAKIGIPYNSSGILHFINQLGINKAREMFFTAMPITAQEALNVGLINHIAPLEDLNRVLEEKLLIPIRRNSILSISAIKRQFRVLSRAMANLSAEDLEQISAWRSIVYNTADYREGITSFIEKRAPKFIGEASELDKM